jgi:hypothetical protein
MSDSTASPPALCPECGASVKASDDACWLCKRPLAVAAELVGLPVPAVVPDWVQRQRQANPAQFSLESLMLVITLIAVCLGMIAAVPGLGVLVSIVAAPALIRTLIAGYYEKAAGGKLTLGEKVMAFVASTGVTLAVLATGASAFATACFGTCLVFIGLESGNLLRGRSEETVMFAFLGISALVGLATAGWMFWILRPKGRMIR